MMCIYYFNELISAKPRNSASPRELALPGVSDSEGERGRGEGEEEGRGE